MSSHLRAQHQTSIKKTMKINTNPYKSKARYGLIPRPSSKLDTRTIRKEERKKEITKKKNKQIINNLFRPNARPAQFIYARAMRKLCADYIAPLGPAYPLALWYLMPRPRVQNDRQLAPRVFELLVKIENTHKTNGF